MMYNGILKHAPLSSFTKSKSGQVLITYSLGGANDMTDLYYNNTLNIGYTHYDGTVNQIYP